MSDRFIYYFREKVTETELNDGFDALERADRAMITDAAVLGVFSGLQVVQHAAGANLTVDVAAGVAYDKLGERMNVTGVQTVDVSIDSGGSSTAVVSAGNSKIVSLFLGFNRVDTDPRTDGNGITVYFNEAESFAFSVVQGAEAPSPSPPPLDVTKILLADITRASGVTSILTAAINVTGRREDGLVHAGTPHALREGRTKNAIFDIFDYFNAHVTGSADRHTASMVDYGGGAATYLTISPATVEVALDTLIGALGSTSGTTFIGSPAFNGANGFFSIGTTHLDAAIDAIISAIDAGPLGRQASAYTASIGLTNERLVLANTTSTAFTLTLPAPTAGREIIIKDQKGTFGTNALTVAPHGAELIEGLAGSLVCSAPWGQYTFRSDGTNWLKGG